jgi:chaperonin GroES
LAAVFLRPEWKPPAGEKPGPSGRSGEREDREDGVRERARGGRPVLLGPEGSPVSARQEVEERPSPQAQESQEPGPKQAVRVLSDRLLVARPGVSAERRSKAGLVIPATAVSVSKKCVWAEVVAVGPNVKAAAPGDKVLIPVDAGHEVEIRGEEYLVVRERDVHAVATEREETETGLYL